MLFKRNNRFKFLIFGTIVLFPLLMFTLVGAMFFLKFSDSILWKEGKKVEGLTRLYEILEEVSDDYERDYGLELNQELIVATIVTSASPDQYKDENEREIESLVKILASYQVMRITKCTYPSKTLREIASNDKSGVDDFLKEEADNERNYNCNNSSERMSYTLSTEEGSLNDDDSGSVYYWNLIDGDFFEYYLKDTFINVKREDYPQKKASLLKEIYKYSNYLKEKEHSN